MFDHSGRRRKEERGVSADMDWLNELRAATVGHRPNSPRAARDTAYKVF